MTEQTMYATQTSESWGVKRGDRLTRVEWITKNRARFARLKRPDGREIVVPDTYVSDVNECPTCDGSGHDPNRDGHLCRACSGSGKLWDEDDEE